MGFRLVVVPHALKVHLDTVCKSSELDQGCGSGNGEERAPEIGKRVRSIDMADIAKSEGDARYSNGGGEESCGNGPAKSLGPVEESFSRHDVPADLEMHRQGADEDLYTVSKAQAHHGSVVLLHTAIDMPPAMMKAPENAHVRLVYMSFGVISS